MVLLHGVGKRYGWRQPWVVRDVSLEIRPGGLMRIEGRNGTGKSTLLRVIAGVSVPTKGTVTGRPAVGYVPERFPPALPFSARDYLGHIGRVHGLADDVLPERVRACLHRLGGLEFADVPLRTMSKGMCQKVAIAQALLPESGLLVLDEAWTGLDVEARAALDEAVAERVAAGGSVVFVDHDPRRLDHLDAERWRIEHGAAIRVSGGQLRPGSTAPSGSRGAASSLRAHGPTVVIEISGCPREAVDGLGEVVSARWDGDHAVVRVAADASDLVLRKLLAAGDDVHIRNVVAEPSDGGQQ